MLGCLLVLGGVLLAAAPSGASSMQIDPRYAALLVMSFAFPSLAVIIKERVFKSAEVALGGQKLDVLVVNSLGSSAQVRPRAGAAALVLLPGGAAHRCCPLGASLACPTASAPAPSSQAVFVLLLLPITTALRGIPLHTLPDYLAQGARCFTGLSPSCGADCSGAPLLPVAYVVANIAFNIAALNLLRTVGGRLLCGCSWRARQAAGAGGEQGSDASLLTGWDRVDAAPGGGTCWALKMPLEQPRGRASAD